MSSVSIVPLFLPLFLPRPVPPFPADDGSFHNAGSTTDADASSNDDNTTRNIPAPIDNVTADVLLNPVEDILVVTNAAARDILVPDAVPPDLPDDVSSDNVADSLQ